MDYGVAIAPKRDGFSRLNGIGFSNWRWFGDP
jgi:hypothetical protein